MFSGYDENERLEEKDKEALCHEIRTFVRATGTMTHQALYATLESLRRASPPILYRDLPAFVEAHVPEIGVQWHSTYCGPTPLTVNAFFFSKLDKAGELVLRKMSEK